MIKKQLDLELLYALARRHRPWSFVLVGPQKHHDDIGAFIRKLAGLPNVHFLGAKPVSELPSYTQHMDVCMLCYKVDDYTKFIYPLKLHESLATGLPCVGAPIRTFQEFLVRPRPGRHRRESGPRLSPRRYSPPGRSDDA